MKKASEIRDQAQEVTDILEVYENDFDMYLHLFCEENNIDDLKKESQSIWNACLYYIYSHVFKGTNQLKSKPDYNNGLFVTNNNAYNYDLLLDIVDIYIYKLCMQSDKEVSIVGFSTLTGINNLTITEWGNNRAKLSDGGFKIYKKLMTFNEERVKVIAVPDIDPETGKSNFDYEFSGFTVEFFEDQQLLMDEISYKCLYKQQPIEREGLLFPDDKIRRYLNLPHGEPEIITGQCDTKGKGTDYFVMPILQKYDEDYYCVDCVCDNTADYEMQYENAANMLVNNKVQECEFERNSGGDRVAMEVNKRVEKKGWICNITDVPTETNKEARIFQCSNWIMQHVIFKDKSLYTPKEPYGVMMSLLKQYSVSGKKQLDDVPDTFSNFAVRITGANKVAKAEAAINPFMRRGY